MKELICIVCPKGCHLNIDDHLVVSGNSCIRGAKYARNEIVNPSRSVTSTVAIEGAIIPCCPVKSTGEIPKYLVKDAVNLLRGVVLHSPVKIGEVVLKNIFDTGVDFIVTRNM